MCGRHWRMVPKSTQNAVYRYYQDGQCDGDKIPSKEWHAAVDIAIAQVARKENRITDDQLNLIVTKAKLSVNKYDKNLL